jgi:thimet oligopeptidase
VVRKLLVLILAVAFAAPATAASGKAAAGGVLPPDNAPFWTGHPDAATFQARGKARLAAAKAAMARMLAVKGTRTIDNTLTAYDEVFRQMNMAYSQAGLIEEVHPDSATRATAEALSQEYAAFLTEMSLNRKVYDALQAVNVAQADAATQHYMKRTLRDFRLAGVDKDDATRERIKKLNEELVLISQEFGRNIREDKRTITATVAELEGLPQDYIERHTPGPDGKVTLTMEYPDYVPVNSYAKNGELRRRMYLEYQNRAFPKNVEVLERLRAKRHALAQLQGFPHYADYVTADKMVGSAGNARTFIDRVVAASTERQKREYEQLLEAKRKDVPGATAVEFWESSYYSEQVRRSQYDFDGQSVRPYLPYAQVKQGVLDLSARIFGVEFRRVPDAPVWHPSVECYEMYDGGTLAGRFYLDMHPRANKYNHAAQFDIRTGIAGRQIPEAALVCNLPGGEPGDAGLCEYDDVETFFHEFGHLVHTLFSGGQKWVGIGGINTEHDFVEAPSQMLEEWLRDHTVLATFARNAQGEVIPADLVRRMNRANDFGKGLQVRRQMVYAGLSLACYDRDPASATTGDLMKGLVQQYQPFPFIEGTNFHCAFGHLDGYSAVYYTYMWSLVIAKDLFAAFDPAQLNAPGVAMRYRQKVLAPGGSKPAAELVRDFLGRDFDERAWKAWLDRE